MRISVLLTLAGSCLSMTACTIPLSQKPLTDATDSEIDERLIGVWEVDMQPVLEKLDGESDEPTAQYRIERAAKTGNAMRCVYLGEGGGKDTFPIYTTHLGMHDYFSIATRLTSVQQFFAICRYELTEDGGQIYLMDHTFIIEQVENERIAGTINRDGERITGVVLQATAEDLRKLLLRHGDKVFDLEHPIACKRVVPSVAKE